MVVQDPQFMVVHHWDSMGESHQATGLSWTFLTLTELKPCSSWLKRCWMDLNFYFLILIIFDSWMVFIGTPMMIMMKGDLHLWATLTFLKFTPDLSVQKVQRFRKRTSRAPLGMHHVQKKNSSRKFIKNHEILWQTVRPTHQTDLRRWFPTGYDILSETRVFPNPLD